MRLLGPVILSSFVLASISGCAYAPSDVHAPQNAAIITPTKGHAREVLVIGPFADEREDPSTCGTKHNGWGMTTSHVDCATPPGAWIADAIENGFRENGYTILPRGTAPHAETIVVLGSVKEFFMSPESSMQGTTNLLKLRINLDVRVPHEGAVERELTSVGRAMMTLEDNNGYDKAAYSATAQLVTASVEAVGELANHPESASANHWHEPVDEKIKPLLADAANAPDSVAR